MFGKKTAKTSSTTRKTKTTTSKKRSTSKSAAKTARSRAKTATVAATRTKTAKQAPYVNSSTIWKSVGGGFSNPGESKVCKVGKYKVLVSRGDRLDRYGNPVHTATLINKDGSLGASYKSNGSASLVVLRALKRNGIDTKYPNRTRGTKK